MFEAYEYVRIIQMKIIWGASPVMREDGEWCACDEFDMTIMEKIL
jgi:hypothetical protein